MSPQRRSSSAVCDSLLCSAAVAIPLIVSVAYFRHDLRQLLRIVFVAVVLFGALLVLRHSLRRVVHRVSGWWSRGKKSEEEQEEEVSRPDLDREREVARKKAQDTHNQKAKDFNQRIAGPRRNVRLEERERRARYIRGFGAEGQILGRENGRLSPQQLQRQVPQAARSHDSRVTQSSERSDVGGCESGEGVRGEVEEGHVMEGDQSGRLVWIALRLPDRMIKKQFSTSQTMRALYRWLSSEGFPPSRYLLCTLLPRSPLEEGAGTLGECGITMDTTLVVEEREEE